MLITILFLALCLLIYRRFVSGYGPGPVGLGLLHRGEAIFIESAAEVLFPDGAGLSVAGVDARLPHYVDRHLAALPSMKRFQIRALLLAFEHLPLFLPGNEPGGRRRFSSLSAASRTSILENIQGHSNAQIRLLLTALRAVLILGYLGHPANLRDLGVAPFEIQSGVSDAERLFPRIGGLVSSIGFEEADRSDSLELGPLDPSGPRHRAYARPSRDSR
ncbi:MAG: hypothetical protein VCB25_05695 [Myxococcota bacterium]